MATAWVPPPGRHTVQIGQSLNRALKARRGEPTHTKSKIPDKEYYSFRCESPSTRRSSATCGDQCAGCCADNFKPGGVDATKPGSIEVRKGQENTNVVVERGSEKVCVLKGSRSCMCGIDGPSFPRTSRTKHISSTAKPHPRLNWNAS